MNDFLSTIANRPIESIVVVIVLLVLLAVIVYLWRRPRPPRAHLSPDWTPAKEGETLNMLKGELRVFVEEVRDTGTEGRRSVIILVDSPGAPQDRFDIPEAGKIQYLSTEGHYYEVTVADVVEKGAKFRAEQFTGQAKVNDGKNSNPLVTGPRKPEPATYVKMETASRTNGSNEESH